MGKRVTAVLTGVGLTGVVFAVALSVSPSIAASLPMTTAPKAPAGFMPKAKLTPGAVNPQVTQANIKQTICVKGYTATIRPPASYTTKLKKKQLASGYAYKGITKTSYYEEDHLISLELGGAPKDVKNLWPEPYSGTYGARTKDKVENKLHTLVCKGDISLKTAQQLEAKNWYAAYVQYVLNAK
jgi:hypothetical protein